MITTSRPDGLPLPGVNEVHVWTLLRSQVPPHRFGAYARLLSIDENQKVARFIRPDDRERCIVAHGALRQLLGHYLSVAPASLAFERNAFGKPALALSLDQPKLSFNLAHSGDVILYAFSVDRRVGVDVEAIRDDFNVMELARSQFSLQEVEALEALPAVEQPAAFFRCWTSKEAYVKALGLGLSQPLQDFSVGFSTADEAGLHWVKGESSAATRWSARTIGLPAGYVGAVFAEDPGVRFQMRFVDDI